jgi:hypothetical protein
MTVTPRRRGLMGEPWFPHDLIDEGGCPFVAQSPIASLYHEPTAGAPA